MLPRVTQKQTLAETKWLRLNQLTYLDNEGTERIWDAAERTTRQGEVDGVDIIAILENKDPNVKSFKSILLVLQYRPPLGQLSLEFPAGLVDAGESCEQAALRELHEETGYRGDFVKSTPTLGLDAGMSTSNTKCVHLSVDLSLPENANPKSAQEDGEFIETMVVPCDNLLVEIESTSIMEVGHQAPKSGVFGLFA